MNSLGLRLARALFSRRTFGLFLLALLLAVRVWDPAPLEELRLRSFDLYQRIQPRIATEHPVVVVDIDEASLEKYGQWPWPRTLVADLVTRLDELQCVAVAFDVIFPEPDRSSPAEAIKQFRNVDDVTRERIAELPSHDEIFARVIGQGRVVLGQSGTHVINTRAAGNLPQTGFAVMGPDPIPYLLSFPALLRNLPILERAAAGRGLFSIGPERDGIVRRVPVVMNAENKVVPSLVLELLRVVTGSGAILIHTDQAGVRSVAVPGLELPTDRNGRIWIHFTRHDQSRYVSAKDVLEGKVGPQTLSGKLVLIGTSAVGLLDLKTTPVDRTMPGVEVHAQLLEAALTQSLLASPGYAVAVEMFVALIFGIALSLLAPVASVLVLFLTVLAGTGAVTLGSWVAYSWYQTLFDATFPLITVLSVYVSLTGMGYFREQLDRRRIRSAFAQYLSPTLVERLAHSQKQLVLGGEDRVMTVLFSDVRDFTSISESYKDNPQGLTTLMNRFLTPLTKAIVARNGTIDKYIGDAIMAFWNAPLDDPAQERNACDAALEMLERVDKLNDEREAQAAIEGSPFLPIRIGIGINTGRCTVGNMGSDLRFQYTVMGDTVNLASRLEGQTKTHGLPIIIGSKTAAAVADQFALLELESIRVKGKREPEVVYTILGRADVLHSADFTALLERWAQLLVCYRKQDWAGAESTIEACRALCEKFGLQGMIEAYLQRIRRLKQDPPGPDWDGVFTAETK